MKLTGLKNKFTKVAGKAGFLIKKNSPEILLAIGIGGIITSTVMACKATLKVDDIIAEKDKQIFKIDVTFEDSQDGTLNLNYSAEDKKHDLVLVYAQTCVKFIKLYGPAVTLGIASFACIIGGHGIMKKRNVALMAAYKVLEEGFAKYRKRVVEEFGEEKDYIFKNGLRSMRVSENEVGEDGKNHQVKKDKLSDEHAEPSVYARFFDETSTQWSKTPSYNLMYIQAQQNSFNELLQARGHVFLNEVYDSLGIPRSAAGAIVGWVLDNGGDNYIDFGVFDKQSKIKRDFVNGHERSILLDFNVDGVIYDLI